MIVISDELVLAAPAQTTSPGGVTLLADNPWVGWHNIVVPSNVQVDADSEINYPLINIANPSTYLFWQSAEDVDSQPVQYITITPSDTSELNYIGIAGHNYGSDGIGVVIEGATDIDSSGDPDYIELTNEVMPADDSPMMFRFTKQSYLSLRIRLTLTDAAPRAAVVYCGELLVLERRLYVGHRIINYNDTTNIVTGRSEMGQFLGRLVLGEFKSTQIELQNITPQFYRQGVEPWRQSMKTRPIFFAWRPSSYPFEVGYCWAMNDMQVSNSKANGFMQASISLQGIAE